MDLTPRVLIFHNNFGQQKTPYSFRHPTLKKLWLTRNQILFQDLNDKTQPEYQPKSELFSLDIS
jgi:hypothetical protein